MGEFIKKMVEMASTMVWMYIFLGIVGAVFLFSIIIMIVKKKTLPVGRSTAIAAILCGMLFTAVSSVAKDAPTTYATYYAILIYAAGGLLAFIGGFISTITNKKKHKHECCENGHHAESGLTYEPNAQSDYFAPPADDESYAPYGGYSSASPEVDALIAKINKICANGASLQEMRDAATQLQTERAKPENKNNPDTYAKLNKALIELLAAIQKR